MSARRPDITIVVETMHLRPDQSRASLDRALECVERQTLPPERYELVVMIDPHRHPDLGERVTSVAPRARIVECPGLHYYAQKNLGAREARAEIVGFVDSDCEPVEGWAAAVVDAFGRHGNECRAVQGRYRTNDLETSAFAQAFLITTFGNQAAAQERRVGSIGASNSAFRRDELVDRPFREDPVYHGPDVEKAAEIRANGGYVLLVPGAATSHDHKTGLAAQHFRGVYWGHCFVALRVAGSGRAPYTRLVRRLGPLAPIALVPAKAWLDVRRLFAYRVSLGLSWLSAARCTALLAVNAFSVGLGAARRFAGLPPPEPPEWFFEDD